MFYFCESQSLSHSKWIKFPPPSHFHPLIKGFAPLQVSTQQTLHLISSSLPLFLTMHSSNTEISSPIGSSIGGRILCFLIRDVSIIPSSGSVLKDSVPFIVKMSFTLTWIRPNLRTSPSLNIWFGLPLSFLSFLITFQRSLSLFLVMLFLIYNFGLLVISTFFL